MPEESAKPNAKHVFLKYPKEDALKPQGAKI